MFLEKPQKKGNEIGDDGARKIRQVLNSTSIKVFVAVDVKCKQKKKKEKTNKLTKKKLKKKKINLLLKENQVKKANVIFKILKSF